MPRFFRIHGLLTLTALLGLFVFPATVPAGDLPAYEPDANHTRDRVPDAYKWDLTPLFATEAAWEAEVAALEKEIPKLAAYEGTLADPASLKKCLDLYFDLHNRASHVQQYANLARATELTSEALQVRLQRSLSLMEDLMAKAGFIRGEVLALDDKTMAAAYKEKNGPGEYRDYLENLRRRRDVYSYATGLCSGIAIAERVKAEGDDVVEAYLGMLKGGCSEAPLELLRGAGVDLSKPDAIEAALDRFDRTVTELAELLDVEI
jgi:oligoendopeptidase F